MAGIWTWDQEGVEVELEVDPANIFILSYLFHNHMLAKPVVDI